MAALVARTATPPRFGKKLYSIGSCASELRDGLLRLGLPVPAARLPSSWNRITASIGASLAERESACVSRGSICRRARRPRRALCRFLLHEVTLHRRGTLGHARLGALLEQCERLSRANQADPWRRRGSPLRGSQDFSERLHQLPGCRLRSSPRAGARRPPRRAAWPWRSRPCSGTLRPASRR